MGVKFTIPASLASGTNLSNDSYVSVERLPKATSCNATMFLSQHGMASNVISNIAEGDITYSVASTSDAGAGNRYEEMVYALPGTSPCVAVRYFVHYGAFENYPAGTTQEFNKPLLLSTFDSIRHTLILSH